jgi:hypothetical protein
MVLRPPIARGLRFVTRCQSDTRLNKAVIEPTLFSSIVPSFAAFDGYWKPRMLLPGQQCPMFSEQRIPGRSGFASRRVAGRDRWDWLYGSPLP